MSFFFVFLQPITDHPMGHIRLCILLLLCTLPPVFMRAQERMEASFSLLESPDGTILLEYRMGTYDIIAADDSTVLVESNGMTSFAPQAGLPSLPQMSRLLTLPRGSSLSVNGIEATHNNTIDLAAIITPYTGATVKDMPPRAVEPNKDIYGSNSIYRAGAPVEVEDLGTMGDRQLFRITVHPMEYLPSASQLTILPTITATLTPKTVLSTVTDILPEKYLIVSRPQFHDGLQPFVEWKRQEGFDVTELYATTSHPDSVKALVSAYFGTDMRWPHYILLVGDAEQMQPFEGTTTINNQTHFTDLYFAEHTGDYLPDALLGRWPVNDNDELASVVEKTLNYEQGLGLDPVALNKVLLVAGKEEHSPAPVTTNGHVNYLGHEIAQSHPAIDTICHRNPSSNDELDSILDNIDQGVSLLSYTAHCTANGWSHPAMTFETLDTIETLPMVYINNCCLSNAFDGTCFGEQLLRKADGGAIGVIGATNSTLWNEDYYWAVGPKYPLTADPAYDSSRTGAFDRWIGHSADLQSLGEVLEAGNLAVTAFGSPYAKFYWEIYCLLGDPSLIPYIGIPQETLFSMVEPPHAGDTEVRLQAPEGIRISVVQADSLLGVGTATGEGILVISLNSSVDTGDIIITATDRHPGFTPANRSYQLLPYADTLHPEPPVTTLGFYHIAITDSSAACQVANLGTDSLFNITINLMQADADISSGTSVSATATIIDTLAPQERTVVAVYYTIATIGQQALWQALLTATADNVQASIPVSHTMSLSYPTASFRLLKPSLAEAHRISAQQEYLLETTVSSICDSLLLTVTALPSGDTLCHADSSHTLLPSSFNSPIATPDSITHLHIVATLYLGGHTTTQDYYLVAEPRTESFEESFSSYPWQMGGTNGWVIDSTVAHSGHFAARSGAIDYRQTSELKISVFVPYWDTISFWARTSSEHNCDKLSFYVDDVLRPSATLSGNTAWWNSKFAMRPGHHIICWRYTKDESGSSGSDCAWVDDIRLPLALWDSDYGWFPPEEEPVVISTDNVQTPHLTLHPNPSNGLVIIEGIDCPSTVLVSDLFGHNVYTAEAHGESQFTINFNIPDGIYIVQIRSDKDMHACKLIITQ